MVDVASYIQSYSFQVQIKSFGEMVRMQFSSQLVVFCFLYQCCKNMPSS